MSIEYFGSPLPPLTTESIQELLVAFASIDGYMLHRKTSSEVGLTPSTATSLSEETVSITLSPSSVYVGFHVSTRDERQRVLIAISSQLSQRGYECSLEED